MRESRLYTAVRGAVTGISIAGFIAVLTLVLVSALTVAWQLASLWFAVSPPQSAEALSDQPSEEDE